MTPLYTQIRQAWLLQEHDLEPGLWPIVDQKLFIK